MIHASLIGAVLGISLLQPAAIERGALSPEGDRGGHLSFQQKRAAVRPLVSSATECIARTVSTDPRFGAQNLNELIVDSVPTCLDAVRRMIDAHDRLFGEGAGETFFVGPYLDNLPAAVNALVKGRE